ncbi:hypothetical protein WMF37_36990 [Sorangium sp. So ce291]|uniref:hypothetical protein n=1 Tax=Sorangium sp. So ce291 TaxID=3133294 RepID=UPI003F613731
MAHPIHHRVKTAATIPKKAAVNATSSQASAGSRERGTTARAAGERWSASAESARRRTGGEGTSITTGRVTAAGASDAGGSGAVAVGTGAA